MEENIERTYHEYITTLFNKLQDIQGEAERNLIEAKERSKRYVVSISLLRQPTKPAIPRDAESSGSTCYSGV